MPASKTLQAFFCYPIRQNSFILVIVEYRKRWSGFFLSGRVDNRQVRCINGCRYVPGYYLYDFSIPCISN